MRIDASGNVGIGTNSPVSFGANTVGLTVNGSSGSHITWQNNGTNVAFAYNVSNNFLIGSEQPSASTILLAAGTEAIRIDPSGDLNLVNTGLASLNFTTDGSLDYARITGGKSGSGVGELQFWTYSGGISRAATISSGGNLLVGRTDAQTADNTAGIYLFPEGGLGAQRDSAASLFINRFGTDGDIAVFRKQGTTVGSVSVTGSATTYNTSSDQRLKENIVDAPSASDDIDAIQVRSFDWKADGSHQKYGMVAQELQSVAPEAVSAPEDPEEMMGVDYSKLVPMMLKEIQSLRARVSELESK